MSAPASGAVRTVTPSFMQRVAAVTRASAHSARLACRRADRDDGRSGRVQDPFGVPRAAMSPPRAA